ncbi:AI-2E family transporter [Gorillibacterium sp. CAU 1737]|uniref:AI-2E family transporter n=1 Tax=Gorillibacterium sp. CAU 1737 TaxID=3140362 RepID=UPI003260EBF1
MRIRNGLKSILQANLLVRSLLVLLLVGLVIWVYSKISFVFHPLNVLFKTLALPVILTGIAYYLLNPIVDFLERKRIKRVYSILGLYLIIAGLLVILFVNVIPFVAGQINGLIENIPRYSEQVQEKLNEELKNGYLNQINAWTGTDPIKLTQGWSGKITDFLQNTVSGLGSFINVLKDIVLALATLPFILFYLLRDGKKLPEHIVNFAPIKMRSHSLRIMSQMNNQISSYIRGQIIVSFCIGALLYVGYLIIGLKYSLTLALIAACTSIVPYLGPAIAITPALIVSMVTSPVMLVKMIVVWTVVQLVEGKFISPQIMGKSLHIHPITIIFVILTAGNLFGFVGIVLAVPGYAVLKVIATNAFSWFRDHSGWYTPNPEAAGVLAADGADVEVVPVQPEDTTKS